MGAVALNSSGCSSTSCTNCEKDSRRSSLRAWLKNCHTTKKRRISRIQSRNVLWLWRTRCFPFNRDPRHRQVGSPTQRKVLPPNEGRSNTRFSRSDAGLQPYSDRRDGQVTLG